MTRGVPQDDWVAYTVVLVVVGAMMLGKYLLVKGDAPVSEVIEEDIEALEEEVEHIKEVVQEDIKIVKDKIK
jgi:hypothetical protein